MGFGLCFWFWKSGCIMWAWGMGMGIWVLHISIDRIRGIFGVEAHAVVQPQPHRRWIAGGMGELLLGF